MPHEFTPYSQEPQPAATGGRRGIPPRKHVGVDLLEPPQPQARQPLGKWNPLPRLLAQLRKLLPR